jgi:hypothetical protein
MANDLVMAERPRRPRRNRRRPAAGGGPRAGHRRPQAPNHHAATMAGASGRSDWTACGVRFDDEGVGLIYARKADVAMLVLSSSAFADTQEIPRNMGRRSPTCRLGCRGRVRHAERGRLRCRWWTGIPSPMAMCIGWWLTSLPGSPHWGKLPRMGRCPPGRGGEALCRPVSAVGHSSL